MAFRQKSYPPPSPYNRRSASVLASGVVLGYDKGERVALKKIPFQPGENRDEQSERYWENLTKLRDDNLVQYRSFTLQDDGRYLAMELCHGSMLEYCRGTLDSAVASLIKGIDVMWQITCAVDYLDRQRIGHGDLKLENVLFKKIDSDPKRVVAKLSGYGCNSLQSRDDIKTDFSKLGCLYISAATKKETRPSGALTTWNLTEIDFNAQNLALQLINLVTDAKKPFTFEAGALLRHPFFIRYCQFAILRLINGQASEEIVTRLKMKENLRKWKKSLGDGQPSRENVSDLERILILENKDIKTSLTVALTTTPQLLSQYIWHLSTIAIPKGNYISPLQIEKSLGEGSFGKVYQCSYMNKDEIRISAACKKFIPSRNEQSSNESRMLFEREILTLSELNHLFIIKYLGVGTGCAEQPNEKYILLELCEGSLKGYVQGELDRVPKDSLDDKAIISQVALGLAYLHSKEIIHKDLKLDNILLKRQPPASPLVLAKITDFGFAKELNTETLSFSATTHPGTLSYMSPQLLQKYFHLSPGAYKANFASDVYSLGITIARIVLKGDHPFPGHGYVQANSMAQGLVPPNLHDLSWDLIDLILKLTDKDPAKRPSMALVLYHPYFILTNDKTKRHLVEQLWTDLSSDNRKGQMKKIFNSHNFQEWYRTITADTELQNISIQPDGTDENEKKYKQKIKNALTAEYDANVGNQIEEISSNHCLLPHYQSKSHTISRADPKVVLKEDKPENEDNSGNKTDQKTSTKYLQHYLTQNRLYKLIKTKPVLLVSYIWSRLAEMINNPPNTSSTTTTSQQNPISSRVKKHQLAQFRYWITNELQWSSLFYGDNEQIADELWKMKYSQINETSQEAKKEIVRTAAKCNTSPAVWSEMPNWMQKNAPALIREVLQSHVPNAPKIANMILEKHWFKEEKFSSFHLAAFNEGNYTNLIVQALFDNKKVPTVTEDGLTPAHIAALNESNCGWSLLKVLLDNGADPNAGSQDGTTPVHWAAMNQGRHAVEMLKLLLERDGDSDKIDKNGLKPIHYATLNTSNSALTLLDLLLRKRGSNVIDSTGRTLLHFAMLNERDCVDRKEILKKLLENRENPNIGDNEGCTPLHLATSDETIQRAESIRLLLQYHSDPNAVDQLGRTPVHYAAANEGEHASENLKLLFARKGSLTAKDKDGLSPIHCAIINKGKCGDEMRKLVGVNPQKTNAHLNSNGESLLHYVVSKDDVQLEIVQLVIQNGGDPNARDKFGRSPVHSAVLLNDSLAGLDILKLLLADGGNVNLQDKDKKFTPVHLVASSMGGRLPEKMKILLNSGGAVNTQGNDGITPLHLAVANSGIYAPQLQLELT